MGRPLSRRLLGIVTTGKSETRRPKPEGNPKLETRKHQPLSVLIILRAHGLVFALEGRHHGMPGEDGTLDAGRELMHTSKHGQLAHVPHDPAGSHHLMDLLKHFLDLGPGLALD